MATNRKGGSSPLARIQNRYEGTKEVPGVWVRRRGGQLGQPDQRRQDRLPPHLPEL
ncbi:hypothetical protein ACFQL1_00215 [Halomicroarcula sp. GCM10025709]|uniref:hypothetical protein n=1 Tax=Halomicroarcula sp. GCM10025709 TaxID=3252669 RepID=UPI003607A950